MVGRHPEVPLSVLDGQSLFRQCYTQRPAFSPPCRIPTYILDNKIFGGIGAGEGDQNRVKQLLEIGDAALPTRSPR